MKSNLYWNVYRNLERELLSIAEYIHVDDNQLGVYSMKIADLIVRCAIEVEAISKELYHQEGGTKEDEDLFFDTDCLALLQEKWAVDKKIVEVSSPIFYFEDEEHKILTPLHNAHKRGSSSSHWQRAYQGLKHDRHKNLKEKGTLRNLISAMAAVYLLNLYYKAEVFPLTNHLGNDFDTRLGSSIFSVRLRPWNGFITNATYVKSDNFLGYTYLIKTTEETTEPVIKAMDAFFADKANLEYLAMKKASGINGESPHSGDATRQNFYSTERVTRQAEREFHRNFEPIYKVLQKCKYEAVLNKNQY